MIRKILHLDLDAFFCAVEEQRNPRLRGRPFAVGGRPDQRGVVSSANYPARKFGVRSAMPMAQALRLCPDLIVVQQRHGVYGDVSQRVMAKLAVVTPLVEQLSIDEAFLDVTDRSTSAESIARQVQASINRELDLPCSLGVASNKLVAKIANNVGKASARGDSPPNAIMVVPPGQEAAFLAPLPTRELWGVGARTAERLAELGMHTIGDIAHHPVEDLIARFGKHGTDMARRARGIDDRPVTTERVRKSVSQERTFARDIHDRQQLEGVLRQLAHQVAGMLAARGLAGGTVKLKLRWPDFTTLTRQTSFEQPTADGDLIADAALRLFHGEWRPGKAVRLLGVGVAGLQSEARQLSLLDWQPAPPASPRQQQLDATLKQLRARFGDDAVQRADRLDPDR